MPTKKALSGKYFFAGVEESAFSVERRARVENRKRFHCKLPLSRGSNRARLRT
jgi:hypothetical protein